MRTDVDTIVTAFAGGASAARDATPPAEADPADDAFLFVQTATGGTFVPNPAAGTPAVVGGGADFLLTLVGHPGGTVYVSDRPGPVFGEAPTQRFLDGLGFGPDNPPNAALVAQTDAGDDVVVLQLVTPAYDAEAETITYGANLLAEYAGVGLAHLAHLAARAADAEPPNSFGRASLFIDDCLDLTTCYGGCALEITTAATCDVTHPLPGGSRGTCWDWGDLLCKPCRDYGDLRAECNRAYADCNNGCLVG